jgi:archaellum component FlaC
MTTIAFDTLKFARALKEKAHLTAEQAEGFAEAITDAPHDDLATKSDLLGLKTDVQALKAELKTDIASVRSELGAEIASVRSELSSDIASVRSEIEIAKRDLKIWFGSVMVVAVGVILAAIRYLPAGHP